MIMVLMHGASSTTANRSDFIDIENGNENSIIITNTKKCISS